MVVQVHPAVPNREVVDKRGQRMRIERVVAVSNS
jgi:hypothetical protein